MAGGLTGFSMGSFRFGARLAMTMLAYIYEGSLEGMLSTIFEAYERREFPDDVAPQGLFQQRLGEEVRHVQTNVEHARRVRAGLIRVCGFRAYEALRAVYLSDDPRKGSIIHAFVRYAMKRGARALDDIAHPDVVDFISLNRSVYNERHHWQEFLRFRQVEGGLYFAQCNPKANVVPLLMGWFSARFNTQDFMIYDEVHDIAGVSHDGFWSLVRTDVLEIPSDTCEERLYSHAWKTFYDAVAVKGRYNPELRRQLMPKRFWGNMTEMKKEAPREGASMEGISIASDAVAVVPNLAAVQ